MPSMLKLRLHRHGQRNTPLYHIVVINSRKRRGAMPIEKVGEYDPIPRVVDEALRPSSSKIFGGVQAPLPKEKKIVWDEERIKYWLGVGVQPTRTVVKLLERYSVPPPSPDDVEAQKAAWKPNWQRRREAQAKADAEAERLKSTSRAQPSPVTDPSGETTGFAGATAT